MFVACLNEAFRGWGRKAAAKCFLWKPCTVLRKYSTPGNVRHICLHPTSWIYFLADIFSRFVSLCKLYVQPFLLKSFSLVPCHRWCKCGVIGVNPSKLYEPSTLTLSQPPPTRLIWAAFDVELSLPLGSNPLLHLNPPAPLPHQGRLNHRRELANEVCPASLVKLRFWWMIIFW